MWVPSQLLCPGLASLVYGKWHGPGNEASPGQLPRLAPVELKRLHGLALSETGHIGARINCYNTMDMTAKIFLNTRFIIEQLHHLVLDSTASTSFLSCSPPSPLQFQGKWFAMKFLLDTPILPEKGAIQFSAAAANSEAQSQIGVCCCVYTEPLNGIFNVHM